MVAPDNLSTLTAKGVGRKFSRGRGGRKKKYQKLVKKYRKMALLPLPAGANGKKTKK